MSEKRKKHVMFVEPARPRGSLRKRRHRTEVVDDEVRHVDVVCFLKLRKQVVVTSMDYDPAMSVGDVWRELIREVVREIFGCKGYRGFKCEEDYEEIFVRWLFERLIDIECFEVPDMTPLVG